eukprot:m.176125 g.176125  ORF g.176125 m.176125 type:complete len:318 (-) comp17934_c0_seq1:166-1119(-)
MQKNLTVVVRLEPQYGASSTATCFPAVPPLRDLADPGTNRTSYKKIAASYARVVSSLPQPPGNDTPFYVQIGNELNIAWSCGCGSAEGGTEGLQCMTPQLAAVEVAHFLADAAAAIKAVSPRIRLGLSPMAPMGWDARRCCPTAVCAETITTTALEYERLLVKELPDLYARADWLSSHSYPCAAQGCGLGTDDCKGWNVPFDQASASGSLTLYRNESRLLSPPGSPPLLTIITETGWCMDCTTELLRANWTVAAFSKIWLPDPMVLAVTPFLLAGAQWWPKGFPWMFGNGTTLPVYDAVRGLRCELLPSSGQCDRVD